MTNPNDTQIINSSSTSQSYTFVPVENPSNNITQIAFTGTNFDEWSRGLTLALLAKGKQGYVDGTIKKPAATASDFAAWLSQNALVTAWIYNSLDSNIRRSISYRPEAKQIWDDIRNRFCQNNDARVFRLEGELSSCRQGPTESLIDYYGRLTKLWDDLQAADPLPACTCDPCTCNLVSILDTRRDKKRVRNFLIGLDDRYDNARSQLLGISPLPTLDFAYNRLLQEEGMRQFSANKIDQNRPETMAFAARTNNNPRSASGGGDRSRPIDPNRPFCIACRRPGHLYPVCFRVTGEFPDWWGERPRDRIYINEVDMSRTVVPDVQGRVNYDRLKKTASNGPRAHLVTTQAQPTAHGCPIPAAAHGTTVNGEKARAHVVSVPSQSATAGPTSAGLEQIDFNKLTPTQLDEVHKIWQARQPSSSSSTRLSGPFFEDDDWCG